MPMERFTITPVNGEDKNENNGKLNGKYRNEVAIDVSTLKNVRRNSRTVPHNMHSEARRISLAQLTR